MLANNRFFGATAATRLSGLAPSPNGLPIFQVLARQSGGYGKTAAVPRGYGAIGLAWPARVGEMAADLDATITLSANNAALPRKWRFLVEAAPGGSLVTRLADRDIDGDQVKRAMDTPGVEPAPSRDDRLKKIEDRYWAEFEKNDLANIVLLRGGRG